MWEMGAGQCPPVTKQTKVFILFWECYAFSYFYKPQKYCVQKSSQFENIETLCFDISVLLFIDTKSIIVIFLWDCHTFPHFYQIIRLDRSHTAGATR